MIAWYFWNEQAWESRTNLKFSHGWERLKSDNIVTILLVHNLSCTTTSRSVMMACQLGNYAETIIILLLPSYSDSQLIIPFYKMGYYTGLLGPCICLIALRNIYFWLYQDWFLFISHTIYTSWLLGTLCILQVNNFTKKGC